MLLCIGFAATAVWSQNENKEDTVNHRYLVVPFGAYAEETGLQLGVLGMIFFKSSTPDVPGPLFIVSGIATTKGQKTAVLSASANVFQGWIRLTGLAQYSDWPGKYWAGGNNPSDTAFSYGMTSARILGSTLFSARFFSPLPAIVQKDFRAGLQYDFEHNITRVDSPTVGSLPHELANTSGNRIGFGPLLQWDSRDHEGCPSRGLLLSLGKMYYKTMWNSQNNFSKSTIDLRSYNTMPLGLVLALSTLWERADGDVPIDRLSMPDGTTRMRGLTKGRLRDRQQFVLQSELRIPLSGKFSSVLFADAGKVGSDMSSLVDHQFHYDVGGGLRYSLNSERRFNFRIDVSYVDNGIGAAASFGEAF